MEGLGEGEGGRREPDKLSSGYDFGTGIFKIIWKDGWERDDILVYQAISLIPYKNHQEAVFFNMESHFMWTGSLLTVKNDREFNVTKINK